jgi:hypothetical protein
MNPKVVDHAVTDSEESRDPIALLGNPDLVVNQNHVADETACLSIRVQLREIGHLRERGKEDVRHGLGVALFGPSLLHHVRSTWLARDLRERRFAGDTGRLPGRDLPERGRDRR